MWREAVINSKKVVIDINVIVIYVLLFMYVLCQRWPTQNTPRAT